MLHVGRGGWCWEQDAACEERWMVLGAGCCVWGEGGGVGTRMLRVRRGAWCWEQDAVCGETECRVLGVNRYEVQPNEAIRQGTLSHSRLFQHLIFR